jgi:hypothetical protein
MIQISVSRARQNCGLGRQQGEQVVSKMKTQVATCFPKCPVTAFYMHGATRTLEINSLRWDGS